MQVFFQNDVSCTCDSHQRRTLFRTRRTFFSTTDANGIIVSGNRVFTRVSAWSADELTGEPHSILRHPDMPRVVFKLLWDEIGAGRPVAAYVKNLAKNGAYYWVIASVVPFDGGYLSVRFKPSSGLFPTVEGLYAQLLKIEKDVEASGGSKSQAMAASGPALGKALASLKAQAFRISLSRLQAQTASAFVAEIVDERDGATVGEKHIGHVYESIGALAQCLSVDTRGLFDDYRVIARGLAQTMSEVMQLGDLTRTLNMIRMTGRVEVSRLKDPIESEVLFESIEKQLAEADGHLRELISAINSIKASTTRGLGQEGMVRGRLERAADAVQRIKIAELAESPASPASE